MVSKLQLLASTFEALKCHDDETIVESHICLFAFGDKVSNEKLVCKVLRSLPKHFDMKVTIIKEAPQNIASLNVDELFESLLTFELSLSTSSEKKNERIVLQPTIEPKHELNDQGCDDMHSC